MVQTPIGPQSTDFGTNPLGRPAPMGYVGLVNVFGNVIRATDCTLNIKQSVDPLDVIDGTVDRSVYKLGPVETEGSVGFPIIMDTTSPGSIDGNISPTSPAMFLDRMWAFAVHRHQFFISDIQEGSNELGWQGDTASEDVIVRYFYGAVYLFKFCKVNTFSLEATQGDVVKGNMTLWGTVRQPLARGAAEYSQMAYGPNYLAPARAMMWPEFNLLGGLSENGDGTGIVNPDGTPIDGNRVFDGSTVRRFTVSINNNLKRNYTFDPNAGYFPQNISTGKRDVTGEIEFQGWAPTEVLADSQHNNPTPNGATVGGPDSSVLAKLSKQVIVLTINTGAGWGAGRQWQRILMGTVYNHQDAASTMDVFTSKVNYRALGLKSHSYQAITGTNDPNTTIGY